MPEYAPTQETFAVLQNHDPRTSPVSLFLLLVLGLIAANRVLAQYDLSLRIIPETLWNCFVHIMPAPLVFTLGKPSTKVEGESSDASAEDKEKIRANVFAAKNEVLRKVFGLDGSGMLKAVSGDRTLRGVGMLLKGSQDDAPPGLGNWDNSCYQNSVIQGLASLRSLQGFLTKGISTFDSLADDSTNGALLDISQKLNNPDNHGRHLWTPAKLKNMSSWQQQDAQEYFSKVLDEIDKEILRAEKQSRKLAGLEDLTFPEDVQPPQVSHATSFPESLRNPLEGLLAQRVGCMSCGFSEGFSLIPFNCLTVPLQNQWGYGCDIRDCLDEYTKLEAIEGVECAKCTLLRTQENLERLLANTGENGSAQPEALRDSLAARLKTVRQALEDEDFADNTVIKECQIPRKNWTCSTKSRQAVVGRPPKSLAIHVNRSMFDEMTGAMRKNHAAVKFPEVLDLAPWALGGGDVQGAKEWSTNPGVSMIAPTSAQLGSSSSLPYELRAVVTHYGRHENGHYICYRRHPYAGAEAEADKGQQEESATDDVDREMEWWWRLSDEDVSKVSKEDVLSQGGVFMLFYEALDAPQAPQILSQTSTAITEAVPPIHSVVDRYSPVEEQEDEELPADDAVGNSNVPIAHETPVLTQEIIPTIPRRTSTATLKAVAAPSSEVEHYEPVTEQDDEESLVADAVSRSSDSAANSVPSTEGESTAWSSLEHLDVAESKLTPKSSFTSDPAHALPPAKDAGSLPEDISPSLQPNGSSSDEFNSDLEDTLVLEREARRHNRQRNSTISVSSINSNQSYKYPPTPLSFASSDEGEPTPYAEPPETALFSPTNTIRNSSGDFGPQTPIMFGGPLAPSVNAMNRALEECIEEEETEPRWTTSRSEYAPSTVGGSVAGSEYAASYAPSSVAASEGDVSDYEGYAESGVGDDEGVDGEETEEAPKRFSQSMRTAAPSAANGEGRGQEGDREKMGLDGLRMVTAS